MFLSSSFSSPPRQQYYTPYSPPRSSPLSERSINVVPRLFDFNMSSPSSNKRPIIQQRPYKPNPLLQTRDAAAKRRRDMFFKRVQNTREDKKWESRGEQIQQLDHVSERKRWEAAMLRQAPPEDNDVIEDLIEDEPLPEWTNNATQSQDGMTEADYIAAQEENDLQQMIAAMEQQEREDDSTSQHFGSDDVDYDELLMECATMVDQQNQNQSQLWGSTYEETMDMDMTDG
ncbi:hypothetical protein GQ44DRAFT_701137 [Phaeosphaeriaceae sp. PMI808]|nr:hypothetical protein GQ44DRAFT_701137 [Phaeosphaeriaceae sp. PMI808]